MADIKFVDDDPRAIIDNILTMHEAITGRTLYPADPERLFILSLAQIIVQQRVKLNATARQTFLRYATGSVLDEFGYGQNVNRLQAVAASTSFLFTLSMPLAEVTVIPVGTRVGPQGGGGELFFVTDAALEIPAGALTGTVSASCSLAGRAGNGFIPGQLNTLIDPLPFVQTAVNVTESGGGADLETDDAYRNRIRNAPESFSTAGPDGAYKFWAYTASQLIIDVSVSSPSPGVVLIVPLLAGGEIPGAEVLQRIEEICSAADKRPLTDLVTVEAPAVIPFNLSLTYWVDIASAASAASIQDAVNSAVQDYVLWQKSKLGRNINPSELIRRVMQAGAYRVDVNDPVYQEVEGTEVSIADQITVTYGGLSDD